MEEKVLGHDPFEEEGRDSIWQKLPPERKQKESYPAYPPAVPQPVAEEAPPKEELKLVGFTLGEEFFGLDILQVKEIIRMQEITSIPNIPPYILGVTNLRGEVIPVVCLRRRFGFEPSVPSKHQRIIVVECDLGIIGVIVDAVTEVLRIDKEIVEETPVVESGVGTEYIRGVGKLGDGKLIIILDVDKIFTPFQ